MAAFSWQECLRTNRLWSGERGAGQGCSPLSDTWSRRLIAWWRRSKQPEAPWPVLSGIRIPVCGARGTRWDVRYSAPRSSQQRGWAEGTPISLLPGGHSASLPGTQPHWREAGWRLGRASLLGKRAQWLGGGSLEWDRTS